MTTDSSSTAAAIEISERVTGAVRKTVETQSAESIVRVERLRARINDLEARGFIKRQSYSAPTTGDFERVIIHQSSNRSDA